MPVAPYSSRPNSFIVIGPTLYFFASNAGGANSELWKSDGTPQGTMLIKRITRSLGVAAMDGVLYFGANDPLYGCGLWKSNGTPEGTVELKRISAGPCSVPMSELTPVSRTLFFVAEGGLWKSNGTPAGTALVKNISAGNLQNVGGRLFSRRVSYG